MAEQLVSVENPTLMPVHDFSFNGTRVTLMDNQRRDVPPEVARALLSQYPFLRLVDEIPAMMEQVAETKVEVEALKAEVAQMRIEREYKYETGPFKCEHCLKEYKREDFYQNHLTIHEPKGELNLNAI